MTLDAPLQLFGDQTAQRSIGDLIPDFRGLAINGRFDGVNIVYRELRGTGGQWRVLRVPVGSVAEFLPLRNGPRRALALAINVAAILAETQGFFLLRGARPHSFTIATAGWVS